MNTALNQDTDFVSAEWFETSDQVSSCLSHMINSGWDITMQGLINFDESGTVVAKPIKIKGKANYTGVGIWRISDCDII